MESKHRRFHDKFADHQKQHEEFQQRYSKHYRKFQRYHKAFKYFRIVITVFYLLIFYLLYRWIGMKSVGVMIAAFIGIKETVEFFFLWRLDKRILQPIEKLKRGVEEISRGNYQVKVDCDLRNDITLLVYSFNKMAEKLQENEKMKAEYEENRKLLIANISHDLKTPITSIQGYIEAILDGTAASPESLYKYLKIINSNAAYMNKLIDDLFLFSKLDMQKLDFQYEDIPVRTFIGDLMEEFRLELEDRHIQFRFEDRLEKDFQAHVDRKRIHQAFRNIIGNAVKYGDKSGLEVDANMYEEAGYLCISIRDNGPGISEDKLPYIFDRFYRIDFERTKDFMSTGLGLAIAKELVEVHGGRITVTSKENEGACFTISLPISI